MEDTHLPQRLNSYPFDVERGAEMSRLLEQDRLVTSAMGGLFPEREKADIISMHAILDIACGPGGWVNEVAFTYPHMHVTGIDISQSMIEYAQAMAQVRHLTNAHFRVMNALEPLAFPDAAFDLVNIRTVATAIPPASWPPLLHECRRLLRPGGTLRVTDGEIGFSNKAAFETINIRINQALAHSGKSFSPTGQHLGLVTVLVRLLKEAGFEQVQQQAHVIDHSFGTRAHAGYCDDYRFALPLLEAFLAGTSETTKEQYQQLSQQALDEMQEPDFCALIFLLTVWGDAASC